MERLDYVGLITVAYFLVCGGPFGIEYLVIHGGPLYTLVGLVVVPLVWSIPQAVMTVDMSLTHSVNGGYIVWIQRILGKRAAWLAAANGISSNLIDLALYPTLFAEYTSSLIGEQYSPALKFIVIFVGTLLNVLGLRTVSFVSLVIMIFVFSPFALAFLAEFREIITLPSVFAQGPPTPQPAAFMSAFMWLYNGWDSLGIIIEELAVTPDMLIRACGVVLILVTLTYLVPLLVIVRLHPDLTTWYPGCLIVFLSDASTFLANCAIFATCAGQLGLFNTGLSTTSRAVAALAGQSNSPGTWLLGCLVQPDTVPLRAIFAVSGVVLLLTAADFTALVEANMTLCAIKLLFQYTAYLASRAETVEKQRAIKFPHTLWGAILLAFPTIVLLCALLALSTWTTVLLCLFLNLLAGLILYADSFMSVS
eukprot:m.13442 g.13442  ORF g.13442 m.13442 type:complete len:422 (+) comp6185_c0_seq1:56-1321(+)